MAIGPQLHILDVSKDAMTGHITVEARIIDDRSSVVGAIERWHIEALEISSKYNGQVEGWLEYIGREMLNRHKSRTAAHTSIQRWKGKKLDIEE
jgi:hypothetical protein